METTIETYFGDVVTHFDNIFDINAFNKYYPLFIPKYFRIDRRKEINIHTKRGNKNEIKFLDDLIEISEKKCVPPDRVALDTVMVISSYLDIKGFENGVYSFHGTLPYNNNGILLMGPSGSGKTTISLYLLKRGVSILSSDKIVVKKEDDKFIAIGGVKSMVVRKGTVEELGIDFSSLEKFGYDSGKWDDYWRFNDPQISDNQIEISKLFILKRGDHNLEVYQIPHDSSALRILENMQHFVYQFPLYILGIGEPLPFNFPSYESRKKAISFANEMEDKMNLSIIAGNIEEIADYMVNLL